MFKSVDPYQTSIRNFGPSKPPGKHYQKEDLGAFCVWSYPRPTGHTKTGARHRGETPIVVEWAFAHRVDHGAGVWVWNVADGQSGFNSRDEAIAAARKEAERQE